MTLLLEDDAYPSRQTEFAVDMTCQNCVNAVSTSLRNVSGIERYDIDLEKKRVTITGKTPPSQLLSALKSTNRQVIVRGSSSANPALPTTAAVTILESPLPIPTSMTTTNQTALAAPGARPLPGMNEEEYSQKVFGISRFVQIAPKTVLMDLTVRLPPPARVGLGQGTSTSTSGSAEKAGYNVYISSTGNMVDPPRTTGKSWLNLGKIVPDKDGYGDMFKEVDGELWEWIGRGCVVEAETEGAKAAPNGAPTPQANGGDGQNDSKTSTIGRIFAGVVARSAGVWGNEKTVCACSGRTMWEEGREMEKSML